MSMHWPRFWPEVPEDDGCFILKRHKFRNYLLERITLPPGREGWLREETLGPPEVEGWPFYYE